MNHFKRFLEAYPKYEKKQDSDQFNQLFSVIEKEIPDAEIDFGTVFPSVISIHVRGHFSAVKEFKLVRHCILQFVPTNYVVDFAIFPIYPEMLLQELRSRDKALSCMV